MWIHDPSLITRSLVPWETSLAQLSLKTTSQAEMASSADVCLRDNDASSQYSEIKIAGYDFLLVYKDPSLYTVGIV